MIAGTLETVFTANLSALRKGMADADKELRAFEKRARSGSGRGSSSVFGPSAVDVRNTQNMSRATSGLWKQTIGLRGAVAGLAAAYAAIQGAKGFKDLLDTTNRIQNALRVVGHEGEELTEVYDKLFDSAQRNYTSVEALTTLYSRLGLAQNELGKSSEEILAFTDRVALALRVQGTNAQEARGALIQLTQAMGSGIVRAEEFNSIVEGAPSILRAAARGIAEAEGSVAKLRKMVIDGELSSKAFFDGFMAGSRDLADVVGRNQLTIDQALTNFNNELVKSANEIDRAANITPRLVSAIENLTNAVQGFAEWVNQNAGPINGFLDALGDEARWNRLGNGIATVQQAIRDAGVAVGANNIGEALKRSLDPAEAALEDTRQKTQEAKEELIEFAAAMMIDSTTIDPLIVEKFNDIIAKLTEGKISAEEAKLAIDNLSGISPDFSFAILGINGMIDRFGALTQAANLAKAAATFGQLQGLIGQGVGAAGDMIGNLWRGPIAPITAADTAPEKRGGKGRKAKTPLEQFNEEIEKTRDRIKLIDQETASVGMLNSVQETNRVRQDLINAAREKGITLTAQQLKDIDAVAEAYGKSTQALDDANRALEMQMDLYGEFGSAIGDALGALISGSEDAERALAKMVLQMIQAVIQAQILNTIGQSNPAVGNLFSNIIGGIFGGARAEGGPVSSGKSYLVGERGPEIFNPGSNGMIIPNHAAFSPASAQGGYLEVRTSSVVENGNLVPLITEVSGMVAGQQIRQSEANLGTTMMKQRLNRRPGIRN